MCDELNEEGIHNDFIFAQLVSVFFLFFLTIQFLLNLENKKKMLSEYTNKNII